MAGRADYEERRQARIERLESASEAAAMKSEMEYKKSHDLVAGIPFGQPNIIGRDALPNLRKKSIAAMERSVEQGEKASHYADKAEAAANNTAISSDDPNAIAKLQEKIAALEAERERVKAANKVAKKEGREIAPWYVLPYISKDIKRLKDRIAQIESVEAMPEQRIDFGCGHIHSDPETNRVIIYYDNRQDSAVTDRLKANGFKWAPSVGGWQRLRNKHALFAACKVCGIDWYSVKE